MAPVKLAIIPAGLLAVGIFGALTQESLLQWSSTIAIVVMGVVAAFTNAWKKTTPEVLKTMRVWRADRRKDLAIAVRRERARNAELVDQIAKLEAEVAWWKKRDERGSREYPTLG